MCQLYCLVTPSDFRGQFSRLPGWTADLTAPVEMNTNQSISRMKCHNWYPGQFYHMIIHFYLLSLVTSRIKQLLEVYEPAWTAKLGSKYLGVSDGLEKMSHSSRACLQLGHCNGGRICVAVSFNFFKFLFKSISIHAYIQAFLHSVFPGSPAHTRHWAQCWYTKPRRSNSPTERDDSPGEREKDKSTEEDDKELGRALCIPRSFLGTFK